MTIGVIVSTVSSSGLFASRIFLPLFLTSLAFFGQDQGWFNLGLTYTPPSWFIAWQFVVCAGVAAALEQLAEENEDFQDFTEEVTPYVKSGVSLVWTLMGMGVLSMDPEAQELLKTMSEKASSMIGFDGMFATISFGGSVWKWILAIPVAVATFVLAKFRNSLFAGIARNDVASELGIASWFARLELAWMVVAVAVLLIAPLVYLILLLGVIVVSWWIKRRLDRKLKELEVDCPHCDEKHYPIATRCVNTGGVLTPTHTLGVVGNLVDVADETEEAHAYALYSWGRCPATGESIKGGDFSDSDYGDLSQSVLSNERYVELADASYRKAFVPVGALSLIPVLGIPLAAVYARIFVLRAYRVHFSGLRKSCNRFLINLLFMVLVAVQAALVPLLLFGPPAWLAYLFVAMTGPAFLWASYKFYRRGFLKQTSS